MTLRRARVACARQRPAATLWRKLLSSSEVDFAPDFDAGNYVRTRRLVAGVWCGRSGRSGVFPVHVPAGRYVLFSKIANDRIMGFDEMTGVVSIFRGPSQNAYGNTTDQQGRLVTCEHRGRGVSCTEQDGRVVTIADRFDGKRLNSLNDVVVAADAAVWFTDPTYGIDSD